MCPRQRPRQEPEALGRKIRTARVHTSTEHRLHNLYNNSCLLAQETPARRLGPQGGPPGSHLCGLIQVRLHQPFVPQALAHVQEARHSAGVRLLQGRSQQALATAGRAQQQHDTSALVGPQRHWQQVYEVHCAGSGSGDNRALGGQREGNCARSVACTRGPPPVGSCPRQDRAKINRAGAAKLGAKLGVRRELCCTGFRSVRGHPGTCPRQDLG